MPSSISHYTLEAEIGRGGMGVVHRAVDTTLGRAVAIKMLPAGATSDDERRRRFVQEARAASALNHPNIVTIHEIGEEDGVTFIVMELVEGTPLDQAIAAGPLPIATALAYARQIAAALEIAHANGIVHRDIKPANIMVTRDGRIKVLDFGLAKLLERAAGDATMSAVATRAGIVMGTAAYMSPEQAEGRPVDARSDVFSFGAVLYEMLAGQRAFTGTSDIGVITSILRDTPPHLRNVRGDVPAVLSAIVDRCLAKKHAARYEHGGALRQDLDAAAGSARAAEPMWRRPVFLIGAVAVLIVLAGLLGWRTLQAQKARDARLRVVPQIKELMQGSHSVEAIRLARQIEHLAPDEVRELRRGWPPLELHTEPAGATFEFKNYTDLDGRWEPLGPSPIRGPQAPMSYYRYRITKEGYLPLEIGAGNGAPPIRLPEISTAPAGMVFISGGPFAYLAAAQVRLPPFWIDRDEVTNAQFKAFVDAGGYRDPRYWLAPFLDGGRTLSFDEAMTRFRDATGRPGPATWETGRFPEGQADFPVGGLSWFEAAAYAVFAGKSLPTIYHWYQAAGVDTFSADVLLVSNFDGKGPSRAGERAGVGPFGTRDMAGNVKEWCLNIVEGQSKRYILGGGWNEPSYRYNEADAQNPWERRATFGVRLIKNLGPADAAEQPIHNVEPDLAAIVPVGDAEFEAYKRSYSYDRLPLDARIDAVDDGSPDYRKETVSFAAAYGGERIPAYLFVPKNAKPPYQTIVLFPTSVARAVPSSRYLDLQYFDFIVKSGRALIYPVYKDTFERKRSPEPSGPNATRDRHVAWAKDVFRVVDYLETRPDIDSQRLAYYSLSMGAFFGPIPLALEPRLKAGVLLAGGLRFNFPPEVDPSNFMPRVKVPMLLVNGKDDYAASAAARQRFLELLGTPAEHKRSVALDGGHVPTDWRSVIREVLDWYDKYLGPVK